MRKSQSIKGDRTPADPHRANKAEGHDCAQLSRDDAAPVAPLAGVRSISVLEPMPRGSNLLTWTGLVALSLALGLGSAALSVRFVSRRGAIRIGPWGTSTTAGGSDSGMYERAAVATHALFVLNRGETVYYRAHSDDGGGDLNAGCDYQIRGRPLDARWWSITAYGGDDFLITNEQHRYSFNMANLVKEPDGSFLIRASPRPQPGNWLPLGGTDHVSFTIRLYVPSAEISSHPEGATLPSITGRCP